MKTKNLVRIIMFAITILTFVMPIQVEAAISGIFVGGIRLSNPNKYLCGGVATSSGVLDGITCTAEFDTATGTLTLYNYNGASINMPYEGQGNLTINLKGNNVVTDTTVAIYNNSGSDIIITSSDNGSLSTHSISSGNGRGILSQDIPNNTLGNIIFSGNANIEIYIETLGTGTAFAIDGKYISFLDDVSVTTTSKSSGSNPNSTIGMNADESITINTTGNISIDSSGHTNDSSSVSGKAEFIIINVGEMTLKYSGDGHGGNASDVPPLFDPDEFSVISTTGSETYVPILKFLDDNGYDILESEVGVAIVPIDVSPGVTDGYGTYKYSASGLPKGLNINPTTGIISGTPTEAKSSGIAIITVSDDVTSKNITINYGEVIGLSNPVDNNTENEKNPDTGDNIITMAIVLILSLLGFIYINILLKKQLINIKN